MKIILCSSHCFQTVYLNFTPFFFLHIWKPWVLFGCLVGIFMIMLLPFWKSYWDSRDLAISLQSLIWQVGWKLHVHFNALMIKLFETPWSGYLLVESYLTLGGKLHNLKNISVVFLRSVWNLFPCHWFVESVYAVWLKTSLPGWFETPELTLWSGTPVTSTAACKL